MPATWPADLPQFVQESGFGETLPDLALESATDSGKPKSRQRFTSGWRQIQATIWCDVEQKQAFEYFYLTTLAGGTQEFFWVNPVTQTLALLRFRKPVPRITVFGAQSIAIAMNLFQLRVYAGERFDVTTITFDSTDDTFDAANTF